MSLTDRTTVPRPVGCDNLPRVVLVECQNCGAPLDVGSGARLVKCAYCNHGNRVRSMNTIAQQSPQGWQPPPTWTPPPNVQASSQPLQYQGTKTYGTGCIWLPIVLISLGGMMIPALMATGALDRVTAAIGGGWKGEEPYHCGGNDSATIEGVTADLGRRTAVVVNANCQLTIKNSTIKGGKGIRATGNRRVVIENSRIEGGEAAVWVGGNKDLEIVESTVVSNGAAIVGNGNASIRTVGGRIEAGGSAFELGGLSDKSVRDTTIRQNQESRSDDAPQL